MTSISDENYGICYFAIKDTHRSLPGIDNIFSLAKTMEKFLNILEAPRQQQQQDNFDEEKTRYISSKISIWDFYGIPQAIYLNCPVEEKSKMFRDYYYKLCGKYYGSTGKNYFLSRLICLVSFLACSLISALIFFWSYF